MPIYAATEDNASPAAGGQQGTLIAGGSGVVILWTVRRGRSTTSTTLTGGREKIQRSTGGATPVERWIFSRPPVRVVDVVDRPRRTVQRMTTPEPPAMSVPCCPPAAGLALSSVAA